MKDNSTESIFSKENIDIESICKDICDELETITSLIPDRYYVCNNGCYINKIDNKFYLSKNNKQLHSLNGELFWLKHIDTLSRPAITKTMKSFDSIEQIRELFISNSTLFEDNKYKLNKDEILAIRGIEACQKLVSETAKKWYFNPETGEPIERNFGEIIALMHSELSEVLESHRKNLMDSKLPHRTGIEVEFADLIIRVFETCYKMNLDLAGAIIEKNIYNMTREDHKTENRIKANGKSY